jgi:predicted nuclease of restriction endonuclease-like RecB superfamily
LFDLELSKEIQYLPKICSEKCSVELFKKQAPDFIVNVSRIDFRSKWESMFAVWLIKHRIKFHYEPGVIELEKYRYLPDFVLPDSKIIVEVKGVWEGRSFSKIGAVSQCLTDYSLFVMNKDCLKRIGAWRI